MTSRSPVILLIALLAGAAPVSRPAATRPAPDPQVAAINKAVEELAREFEAHLKDPTKPIRTESDYFKKNPVADVTPEGVLRVLERPMNADPRLHAYVKWQLLSAVPGQFDAKLVARAGAAYVRAPAPMPRPGVTNDDRQAMQRDLQQYRGKLDELNAKRETEVEQFEASHEPILQYRTLLHSRLPTGPETIAAGLEDVALRVAAGVEFDRFLDSVLAGARNWLLDGKASPRQLAALADIVERVRATKPPQYYDSAYVNAKGTPAWRNRTAKDLDEHKGLNELLATLRGEPKP